MQFLIALTLTALLATPAVAQQAQTPAQILQGMVGQLAGQNAELAAQNGAMQAQMLHMQARIKELEDKYEPKLPPAKESK